jgi:ketosteroid isomerase-like protein
MKQLAITASLLVLGATLSAGNAVGQITSSPMSDVDGVNAATAAFIAAIGKRDIQAMEKLWVHEPYATFVGPLSTTVVVGWNDVRKAWEMRFSQFDRVTIALAESYAHSGGKVAWTVGIEKVELLRKEDKTLSFNAFVTNVLENRGGQWLLVSHHATPIFKGAD